MLHFNEQDDNERQRVVTERGGEGRGEVACEERRKRRRRRRRVTREEERGFVGEMRGCDDVTKPYLGGVEALAKS